MATLESLAKEIEHIKLKSLTLIKFGGSLITNKNKEETVSFENIDNLSSQIKEVRALNADLPILIGNGAGSFGHIQVKKYGLSNGITADIQKLGFSLVSHLVAKLNSFVVASLLKHKIPVISIKPSSIAVSSKNMVQTIFIDTIIHSLKNGIIPTIYGDMIYDHIHGSTVLSTDTLFYELVRQFKKLSIPIDKIIFCGFTKGVLDNKGRTISRIDRFVFSKIQSVFFSNSTVDVTGGMKKKVEIALDIAELGTNSYIINGKDLKNCLLGREFVGTTIV